MTPVEFLAKSMSHDKTSDSKLRDILPTNLYSSEMSRYERNADRDTVLGLKKTRDVRIKCVAGLDPGSIKNMNRTNSQT